MTTGIKGSTTLYIFAKGVAVSSPSSEIPARTNDGASAVNFLIAESKSSAVISSKDLIFKGIDYNFANRL